MKGTLGHFGISNEAILSLGEAYAEPWRTYHNTSHILQMCRSLSNLSGYVEESEKKHEVTLMIIYHDAWYKVKREPGVNERKSTEWAMRDLRAASAPARLIYMVEQGILATVSHTLEGVDPAHHEQVGLLLDLDLQGFGKSAACFTRDTEAIWGEFQPVYTREEYNAGRTLWARKFLEQDRFYHTPEFSHLEPRARANLERLAFG